MSPSVGTSRPDIILRRVDFPQPEGPTNTTNSPSFISRFMSFKTFTSAKDYNIFSSFNAFAFII